MEYGDSQMDVPKRLLPFTLPSKERGTALSSRIELAIMFCLAEISRDKGRGLISKRAPEELLFVAEICYPFWLVPWRKRTILLDGLNIRSHTISVDVLPDTEMFVREVAGTTDKLEAFSAFLSHNLGYFEGFSGKGQKVIKGLIGDAAFVKDFQSLISRARQMPKSSEMVVLSLLMDRTAAEASRAELLSLRNILKGDIRNLRVIVKTLARTMKKHVRGINKETKRILRTSEVEIASLKCEAARKVEELGREHHEKIAKVSKDADRRVQVLSQERARLEVDKQRLSSYEEKCEIELSEARIRKDEAAEGHWSQELEKCRQELAEAHRKAAEIDEVVQKAVATRDLEISKLRSEHDSKVESIESDVRKAEAVRGTRIQMNQQTLVSLEQSTSAIVSQIKRLIESRRLAVTELDNMGYPVARREYSLVYLPFFIVCYKRDLKRRYVVFPPSIANTMSAVAKIKGALRPFNVRGVLQEISMPITDLLNEFANLIEKNPIFEDEVADSCTKANVLRQSELRRRIEIGLKELSGEGWLSEDELRLLSNRLSEIEH